MSNKKKKQARAARPPAQSRQPRKGSAPAPAPPTKGREISELDAFKFRLARQKAVAHAHKLEMLEKDREIFELTSELNRTKEQLMLFENQRDIGHLELTGEEQLVMRDGKYILEIPPPQPGIMQMPERGESSPPPPPSSPPPQEPEEPEDKEEDPEEKPGKKGAAV